MQKIYCLICGFIMGVAICSCNKSLPALDNFNAVAWKEDVGGCTKTRLGMIESVLQQKEKLLALDEIEIVKVLGKPDRNELYKRNQKFFYYFIEPSEACAAPSAQPKKLAVRFNAMGLAKEINLE